MTLNRVIDGNARAELVSKVPVCLLRDLNECAVCMSNRCKTSYLPLEVQIVLNVVGWSHVLEMFCAVRVLL